MDVMQSLFNSVVLLTATVEEGGEHSASLLQMLIHSNVFNILIAFLFLGWVVSKLNLGSQVDKQRETISQEVLTLEQRRDSAKQELETLQRRTANLSTEVEEILKNAEASAKAFSQQMLSEAEAESERIVDASKKRIEMEERAVIQGLQARLLTDAAMLARERLTRELTQEQQQKAIEAFIADLPKMTGAKSR